MLTFSHHLYFLLDHLEVITCSSSSSDTVKLHSYNDSSQYNKAKLMPELQSIAVLQQQQMTEVL